MSEGPVCMVIGAGAGIGGTVAERFAAEGYHAAVCRRSDQTGLDQLIARIQDAGGRASGMLLNAAEDGTLEAFVEQTEAEAGPIGVVVYNLGAQIGDRSLDDTSLRAFELGWRLGAFGLFRIAKAVCPRMAARDGGVILVTSATAAVRGNAGQHSHAAAMGARRMLCQTLNAQYARDGVHVAHIIVDGAVDAPDTLGKMLGAERFQDLRDTVGAKDGLLKPEHIADTYLHVARQHRSAWTHELDLRPYSDVAWWNHP